MSKEKERANELVNVCEKRIELTIKNLELQVENLSEEMANLKEHLNSDPRRAISSVKVVRKQALYHVETQLHEIETNLIFMDAAKSIIETE